MLDFEAFIAFDVVPQLGRYCNSARAQLSHGHVAFKTGRSPPHVTVKSPFEITRRNLARLGERLQMMEAQRIVRRVSAEVRPVSHFNHSVIHLPMEGVELRQTINYLLDDLSGFWKRRSEFDGAQPHMTIAKRLKARDCSRSLRILRGHGPRPSDIDLSRVVVYAAETRGSPKQEVHVLHLT